ncbi:MotA/TolQ/ExbB proton channel family protein [Rhizorhabdus sp.]|uniref:motility protein A n=1 Tax=Rhizorhabdus sp. TaxID=1968843 RepID=UPI0025FEA050|nr:MotA/TolQ/ExbB proton channel family protein [Rhizorhabdus sp.]
MMIALEDIARYIDPIALMIVIGGTFFVTVFRSPLRDIGAALRALAMIGRADPAADASAARVCVSRIRELAELRSLSCVDRVETAQRFLLRAARTLSDARNPADFSRWAESEIEARRQRHQAGISVWRSIAEAAPAMGMIGTIIGLIQMFSRMDDPAQLGPAMAIAMLTTLYGVLLSSGIAAPIAGRLEGLSEAELAWQESACRQLELIAREELDRAPPPAPVARPRLRTVP